MRDAGGEQAERGHLLLMQHVRLGFLQFARALGDAGFQLGLVFLQGLVELAQVIADALEQQRQALLAHVTQPSMTSVSMNGTRRLPSGGRARYSKP